MKGSGFEKGPIIHRYPRLFALKKSRNFSVIRFSSIAASREYLIRCLSSCTCALVQELPRGRLEDFVDEDTQQKLPEELLDQANHLHETLAKYWVCTCLVTSHLVSLNLGSMDRPQSTDGYMKFNLLLACSDEHHKWQEGEISVRMSRYDFFFRLARREDRKLIRYHSRVKVDAFQSGVTSQKTIALGVPCVEKSRTTDTFCSLIKKARKHGVRLCLQVDGNAMTANTFLLKEFKARSKEGLLLPHVTSLFESPDSRPSTAEMNRLAFVLACTLLQLYDHDPNGPTHWMSPIWMERYGIWKTPKWTDHVRFYYQSQVEKKVDIQQPYLLSQTNGPPLVEGPPFDNPDDLTDAMHRAPGILALGKALLELQIAYFGLSLEPELNSEDSQTDDDGSEGNPDFSDDGHPTINTDYIDAVRLKETHQDKLRSSHHWYYEAIDACLNPNLDPTLSVREYIYKNIVKPPELNYHINSPSPEQLQERLNEIDRQRELSKAVEVENAIREGLFDRDDVCLYGDDEVPIHSGEYVGTVSYTESRD